MGDVTAKKLISHCGSAELVFTENKKSLESIPNINKKTIDFINSAESLKRAEQEKNGWRKTILTIFFIPIKSILVN